MQSIGERLEEARKRKGITVREAAEATKIRGDYLNSFENNSFKLNLPDIYIRGFLRSYANYLKMNSDKIMTDYNAHLMGEGKSARKETREFFGRLELQQPLVQGEESEPEKTVIVDEAVQEMEEDEPTSFWDRLPVEKDIAIKIGIAALLAFIAIIVIIWGFLAFIGSDETPADSDLDEVPTLAPASRGTPFTLIANGDVRVDVQQIDGNIPLHSGVIPQGQEVDLSAVGSIRITYSDAAALSIRIGEKTYSMQADKSTMRITPSKYLEPNRN